ncbi:MAG: hypothetical protein IJ666_07365 [Ruminococcus sp.]|nr:hypothetical protein [Ruminococcus sp.]
MTGTGTQADPYICDTWEELISVSTSRNNYIQMSDSGAKVVDFNEIQSGGFQSTVNLSGQINFKGWTFKNFYSTALKAVNVANGSSWEHLTFDDFLQEAAATASGGAGFICSDTGSSAISIRDCHFFGKVNYGIYSTSAAIVFNSWNYRIITFEQCAFNVECACTSGVFSLFRAKSIRNCNVKFDINSLTANLVQSNSTASEQYIFNSLIEGKISVSNTSGTVLVGSGQSGYNVFKVETNVPMIYAGGGVSVFNNALSPDTVSTDSFVGCTPEQLRSASHLYSVGFPCYR